MSVRGGFLVIGVDGRGRPTGTVTDAQARLFDEARWESITAAPVMADHRGTLMGAPPGLPGDCRRVIAGGAGQDRRGEQTA